MTTIEFDNSAIGISKVYGILSRLFPTLKDKKKYVIEVKEYREKRSLSANGYYWQLVDKIAKALEISKDELHETLLQRYGTFLTDENDDVVKISTITEIDPLKCGVHCKYLGSSILNETMFYHYALIKGSSKYDTKEMSCLINGAVSEAKEMDIETLTPEQLALLNYEAG